MSQIDHFCFPIKKKGSFQLLVEVYDDDNFSSDDHVDSVYAEMTGLAVSSNFTSISTYTGVNGEGSISLQFQVVCETNFYGANCASYCINTNSSSGHYTCDSDGTKTCLPGWSSPSTNCLTRKLPACFLLHTHKGIRVRDYALLHIMLLSKFFFYETKK